MRKCRFSRKPAGLAASSCAGRDSHPQKRHKHSGSIHIHHAMLPPLDAGKVAHAGAHAHHVHARPAMRHTGGWRETPACGCKLSAVPQQHQAAAACALTALVTLAPQPVQAAEVVSQLADATSIPFAVGGVGAIAALGAALIASDPQARRSKQTKAAGGDEKSAVESYFNTKGFERWNKIYSDSEDVNKVQKDIRLGHAQTVDKVLRWLDEGSVRGTTVCDAGCGTGSLAIPLALRGASVSASDLSQAMASEASRRYEEAVSAGAQKPQQAPRFEASDLESLRGRWDLVTCLDVLIHYDKSNMESMIAHLAGLADKKLILSFAPKTLAYTILKRIGELFPGPSQATRAYLHSENEVQDALRKAGFRVVRKDLTATSFYFSQLFEAERI